DRISRNRAVGWPVYRTARNGGATKIQTHELVRVSTTVGVSTMNRLGVAVVLLVMGLAVADVNAASPDPKDLTIPPQEISKAKALVRKLSSEVYREREDAQDELVKMGRLAMPAL